MTAHRAKGFDMGLLAILEKKEDIAVYADHPAHLEYVLSRWVLVLTGLTGRLLAHAFRVQKMREELCDDALAYDMEF